MRIRLLAPAVAVAMCAGCASVQFQASEGLKYYEGTPALLITTAADCSMTTRIMMVPTKAERMKLKSGFGSSTMTVKLTDGMVGEATQTVDSQIDEFATVLKQQALALDGTAEEEEPKPVCAASLKLHRITDGIPEDAPMFDTHAFAELPDIEKTLSPQP